MRCDGRLVLYITNTPQRYIYFFIRQSKNIDNGKILYEKFYYRAPAAKYFFVQLLKKMYFCRKLVSLVRKYPTQAAVCSGLTQPTYG